MRRTIKLQPLLYIFVCGLYGGGEHYMANLISPHRKYEHDFTFFFTLNRKL